MRVAVDARELEGHPTGVGRVLEGLLQAWPAGDELVLISREPVTVGETVAVADALTRRGPRGLPGSLWEQFVLPGAVVACNADTLVSPAYGMPWNSPCPTAVGMHDCACFALPEEFRWRERHRRQWAARVAGQRAAFLFMGSEFAAQEARRYLGVDRERSLVLPYGVGRRFGPQDPEAVRSAAERFGMRGRTVLFVGAHLQRRMLPELAEAVGRLARARPDLRLCLVGEPPTAQDRAGAALPEDRVQWLGWLDDEDLPAVYAAATVVAYPSTYEGFGLPVLEGLACGTPVVTSDAGSLGEIYPGRAWVVPSNNPAAWESALATLLDSPETRQEWTTRALAWAASRRWETAAAMLRERLRQARGTT